MAKQNNKYNSQPAKQKQNFHKVQASNSSSTKASTTKSSLKLGKWVSVVPYLLTFALVWIFCSAIYGDVFTRAQQESYISSSGLSMQHLLRKDFGQIFLYSRYLLLVWKDAILGGLFMAIVATITTYLLDKTFRLPKFLNGLTSILSFGILFYFVYRGYSLFYKNEPSIIVLYPTLLLLTSGMLYAIQYIIKRFVSKEKSSQDREAENVSKWKLAFFLVPVVMFAGLTAYTKAFNDNEIITCRMQNRIAKGDIEEISLLIDDALEAKQPSRSVAAYYAVGGIQTQQLLERLFELEFRYPEMKLDKKDGYEEYGIFQSDCNLFAGLVNAAYRTSMDYIVMNGPTITNLKRMAICAVLMNEPVLAEKYATLIEQMPFEGDFAEKVRQLSSDRTLVEQDPILSQILKLAPVEKKFEQNYRQPIFMGYNVGVLEGSNETLAPSIAACLYSKDLTSLIQRAGALKQIHNGSLPTSVLEALAIRSLSVPDVLRAFPELNVDSKSIASSATNNLYTFMQEIQDHYKTKYSGDDWKEKMKKDIKGGIPEDVATQLKEKWLGTYIYYYYCENLVKKEEKSTNNNSGVN